MKYILIGGLSALMLLGQHINTFGSDKPLFASEEPLELVLVADMVTLMNDKSDDPEYSEAMLIQSLPDLKIKAFEIKVKARGHTRRVTSLCEFPPLKINFKKNKVKNTVFDGQDKLKFVSQCRMEDAFKEYVLQEYLVYKAYNLLTEKSFKTRLVNITIKDNKLRVPAIQMTGFLIEDENSLAKRIGATSYKKLVYSRDSCEVADLDRLALFQMMIGNTDWYISTRHNIKVFKDETTGKLIPVPYDFDFSGVINTSYAKPSAELPIHNVRQRYYKGNCHSWYEIQNQVAWFNKQYTSIKSLYQSCGLLPKYMLKADVRYLDKFYKIINNPTMAGGYLATPCAEEAKLQVSSK